VWDVKQTVQPKQSFHDASASAGRQDGSDLGLERRFVDFP
jgi:hypothetical protein